MRKIDELVATRVMGWKHDFRLSQTHAESWRKISAGEETGPTVADGSWSPSTNLRDAWEVVDEVQSRKDGWIGFQLNTGPGIIHENEVYRHSARFFFACYRAWDYTKYADSTPMAICLAALRSVGGLTDQEITAAMEAK